MNFEEKRCGCVHRELADGTFTMVRWCARGKRLSCPNSKILYFGKVPHQ